MNRSQMTCTAYLVSYLVTGAAAHSQTLPASVAACAAETDVLKRLSCYDREVPRYLAPGGVSPAPPASPASAQTEASARAPQPISPAAGAFATAAPEPPATVSSAPHASSPAPPANPAASPARIKHLQARIVSIEPYPDAIVLHLDNGQVWQQIDEASADLGLRAGDTVEIDRALGSYWIVGHNGATAKARLRHRSKS